MTTDMHAERIATALERIADALERPRTDRLPELVDIAQRGLDRVAASFRPTGSPDDSRVAMQDLAMELRDALDAKPCDDRTCTDRDHWAPMGPNRCDPGCTRPSLHDGDCDNHRATGLSAAWDACEVAEGYLDGSGAARPSEDPLDEDDHRPRHDRDGDHWNRWPDGWGQTGGWFTLANIANRYGPLTFCDCDDATIEAENGATD